MEGIIKDIVDKGSHFEIQIENPDLSLSCHKYKKGHGWEDEVTFDGVTKPRWLIHIEKKYADKAIAEKKPLKNMAIHKKFIGKRIKDGKLQD